jgi:hypothetical protein
LVALVIGVLIAAVFAFLFVRRIAHGLPRRTKVALTGIVALEYTLPATWLAMSFPFDGLPAFDAQILREPVFVLFFGALFVAGPIAWAIAFASAYLVVRLTARGLPGARKALLIGVMGLGFTLPTTIVVSFIVLACFGFPK